jgi:adenosylcobinamide-GDP ribazoletransferase
VTTSEEHTHRAVPAGLRLAVSLLTIVPVRCARVDREAARWAMTLAPVAGLLVGVVAAVVLAVSGWLGFGSLLSAALAVGAMAVLTRGLHLDGLADLADGLGSGKPAAEALTIMKKSDIGPFGVITLVIVLAIQVAAIAETPVAGVVVAAMTGRLAVTWGCRSRVRAARPDGLGALMAGTVRPHDAVAAALVTAAAGALAALTGPGGGASDAVLGAAAVLAGLAVSAALLRHAVRRLGGVTGDVLGALVETGVTAALLVMSLR